MLIAEVSSNHNRSKSRCLEFVKQAKKTGFDAIKFQLFKIDQLFTNEVLEQSKMHRDRKNWELPAEFLPEIYEECQKYELKLGITPFYIDAINEAVDFVDFFKVASYELLWGDLHREIIKTKKETIISTGMATIDEVTKIKDLYQLSQFDTEKLTFLHCESSYPASFKTANLSAIKTMRERLETNVGWSDHTRDIDVVSAAIFQYGAKVIEMHFDLDGAGDEAAGGHCWLPDQVEKLIQKLQKINLMKGDGEKKPSTFEEQERLWRADPLDGLRPTLEIRGKKI